MPRLKLLLLLTTILLCVSPGFAQPPAPDPHNIDASAFGERVRIPSTWLFSPADDPQNALPTLDDRSWTTISGQQPISAYGFHNVHIGWFRVHVHLPSTARNVVLEVGSSFGQYQAFANGVQIAGPATISEYSAQQVDFGYNFRIPERALSKQNGQLVLAIRADSSEGLHGSSEPEPPRGIYVASADEAPRDASYTATHYVLVSILEQVLCCLFGFVSLALYLAMRSHREYLAATVTLFTIAVVLFHQSVERLNPINARIWWVLVVSLLAVLCVAQIEFLRLVLLKKPTRIILAAEALIFFFQLSTMVHWAASWSVIKNFGPGVVQDCIVLALLIPASRRRNVDALVLLPIFCVGFLDDFWELCRDTLGSLSHPTKLPHLPSLFIGSYILYFRDLDGLFFSAGMLLFLVLRTVRLARERARVSAELEAAHSMQQLLLARSSEPTPGFDVQSVYLPASEVGGDFFLVSPDPEDGSILAILGDVSGKGLQAAMRVSMILGVLGGEESREPATVLLRLNKGLLSREHTGFTTACCVRLHPDGRFTVANAGHISPYIHGAELETSPGLPLGLASGHKYDERTGQVEAGARIILMSDGVVEARSKKGELYGFDRLAALTLSPAREIASTAQAFGQDDDITVLTLACTNLIAPPNSSSSVERT